MLWQLLDLWWNFHIPESENQYTNKRGFISPGSACCVSGCKQSRVIVSQHWEPEARWLQCFTVLWGQHGPQPGSAVGFSGTLWTLGTLVGSSAAWVIVAGRTRQRGSGCSSGKDWPSSFILGVVWLNWSKEGASGAFVACSCVEMKAGWGGRREECGGKEEKGNRNCRLC